MKLREDKRNRDLQKKKKTKQKTVNKVTISIDLFKCK